MACVQHAVSQAGQTVGWAAQQVASSQVVQTAGWAAGQVGLDKPVNQCAGTVFLNGVSHAACTVGQWNQIQDLHKIRETISQAEWLEHANRAKAVTGTDNYINLLNKGCAFSLAVGVANCCYGMYCLYSTMQQIEVLKTLAADKNAAVTEMNILVPIVEEGLRKLREDHLEPLKIRFTAFSEARKSENPDMEKQKDDVNAILHNSNVFFREASEVKTQIDQCISDIRRLKQEYEKSKRDAYDGARNSAVAGTMSAALGVATYAVNPYVGVLNGVRQAAVIANGGAALAHGVNVGLQVNNWALCGKALEELDEWHKQFTPLKEDLDDMMEQATGWHNECLQLQDSMNKAVAELKEEERKKNAALMASQEALIQQLMDQLAAAKGADSSLAAAAACGGA